VNEEDSERDRGKRRRKRRRNEVHSSTCDEMGERVT